MKKIVMVAMGMAAGICAAAIELAFPEAVNGTVTMRPEGGGDVVHSVSEKVQLEAGGLYGFAYEGREVGSGLLLAGSQDVNVDRHCPDQSWYNFSNVFQAQGAAGDKARAERLHFGHYNGKGEFSFRGWRLMPIKAEYVQANGIVLGHGESLVANRYTFNTCLSGFARNAARPLVDYRGASFNTSHWNVSAPSKIVYRHELAGRRFLAGELFFTCGYNRGKAGMTVMVSRDGVDWQTAGTITNTGSFTFTLPAAVLPAERLMVRLQGQPGVNLQISQYSFSAKVDGEPAVVYGGSVYRDPQTGAVFGEVKPPVFAEKISPANAQLVAETAGVSVWGTVADVKVFRGTPVPTVRAGGLSLSLAANERESVQLVVNAGAEPLADARVTAGRLTAADGKGEIGAERIEVRRVSFLTVRTPTDETGACGDWPDPLEPQDAAAFKVAAGENQPFWVTVSAPKGTKGGVYTGALELTLSRAGGKCERLSVPFSVEVYDFELPDRLTCETAYGFSTWRVADFHRVKPHSFDHDRVLEKYLELFADYRLTVYHWGKGESPKVTWKNAKDPARAEPVFDWSEFDDAVTEMRGRFDHTALRVKVEGLGHGFQKGFTPGEICGVAQTNEWYQPLMGRYLGALERHLKEKGWLKPSYVYWFDEPNPGVLGQVLQGMLTLKRHAPGLRRMLTYPASKELWEGVNLWNPRLDGYYKNDSLATRERDDNEFWWYICCGPHAPYPTEFIDHAGDELRAWLWMTWNEGVKGTLIWETSLWTSPSRYPDKMHPQNPYEDPMAWSGSGGTWGNGDGRFVYPPRVTCGARVKNAPPVFERPNPSYRLAILRDGLEDYEYFAQLKKVDPRNPLLKVPETVYRKLDDFSADPTAMREHRAKLAREIVRLKGGAPRREPVPCVAAWHDGEACSYRVDKWRKLRHEAKMAEIAAHGGKDYDLVMLGDSITELWEWKAPRYGTNEFAKLNSKLSVLELGYGGDGIQHVLWRVENGELDGYRAKNISLLIGANNKGHKPEEMAAGVKKLLAAIKAKQPTARIALYAIFPCAQTWRNLRNRAANELYAGLADGKTVFFRDITSRMPVTLMPDGLHPNEAGYAIWRADLEDFCAAGETRLVELPPNADAAMERKAVEAAEKARHPGERLVFWGKAQRWGVPAMNLCYTPRREDAQAAADLLDGKLERPGAKAAAQAALTDVSEVVYVSRASYPNDHHNTATIFQCGEINARSYGRTTGALKAWNPKTGATRVIVPAKPGRTVRDPEVSWDGQSIVFAMRESAEDDFHIYTVRADGSNLRQLTRAKGVSDLDPAFLPDGDIVFSATRDPKYCMCNRHIMANLYRMRPDGANIHQIGKSTLFEGHSSILPDGRVLYDRWEYVDRNFGDAQGLWTCNPDGTAHAIYWGNNTTSPGGAVNARALGDGSQAIAVFASCHDRPWGALGIVDRTRGVDGRESVLRTWPASFIDRVHAEGEDFDSTRLLPVKYADPMPIDDRRFLAVRQNGFSRGGMSLVYLDLDGNETELLTDEPGVHTPVLLRARKAPAAIPCRRNFDAPDAPGLFYVQNVYPGTHMKDVKPGEVKALRIVESPEKRHWTPSSGWFGHGEEAPAMNWHSFENKRILGTVPVEADGSAYFEVPGNTFVYFQALDAEGKMVQSMRSGVIVQPGEKYGCTGCHEARVGEAAPVAERAAALKRAPSKLDGSWNLAGLERGAPKLFSFQDEVQPVFTKNCLKCHDYGCKPAEKLNLSGDRGAFFCTSYVDLWALRFITCAGGGHAEIYPAKFWGSHASKLTQKLYGHGGVKLSDEERARVITWMDLNGAYYPVYASAYPTNPGGRMPLTKAEKEELERITGVAIANQNGKRQREQLNFDRPEQSRILAKLTGAEREKALALIRAGGERLHAKGRGDTERGFVPCELDLKRERRYAERQAEERRVYRAIRGGAKAYDVPDGLPAPDPAPGFTVKLKVDCANALKDEALYTYGAMKLSLRMAGKDPALQYYDRAGGNYLNFPLSDGTCPVIEAVIAEKSGRVGIPLGFLREPAGVHEVTVNWTGAKLSILVDGELDEEMPNPVKCPVVWPENAAEARFSPRISEVALSTPNLANVVPPMPDSRAIAKAIQYWTPHGHNASVGDVVVCNWDGRFHVFYLFDRRHHSGGCSSGRHFFAHVSSGDLVNWTEHPHATEIDEWWQTCGTGTPFKYDGKYCLAYGLHTGRYLPHSQGFPRGGTYAVSEDAIRFRPTGDIFTTDENPSVFNRADGALCMGVKDGRILRSPTGRLADLKDDGPGAKCGGDCPCPFSWGDGDYMLQGFQWMSGRIRGGEWEDWTASGDEIYDGVSVPMVAEWKDGRRIYAGWIKGLYGWGGHLVLRELVRFEDGKLGMKWLKEAPSPGEVKEYEVTELAKPFILRFEGNDSVEFRIDPAEGRAQFTYPKKGEAGARALTAREIVMARPEAERFSRGNQKGDFAWKLGPMAIEKIRGLDRPFKVRFSKYYDRKFDTTVFDAEIAGTRCLITRRAGKFEPGDCPR